MQGFDELAALAATVGKVSRLLEEPGVGLTIEAVVSTEFVEAVRDALWQDPTLEARYLALEAKKAQIVEVLRRLERGKFKVVALLKDIQREELFRAEWNAKANRPYNSFSEYLPDLLEEWRKLGVVSASSVRQVREYLRIDNLFVQQLGVSETEVVELGITNFTQIAEGLAYDHATGLILDEATDELPPGKFGRSQALALVNDIRENQGTWTVGATTAAVDALRGIVRTTVVPYWAKTAEGRLRLKELVIYGGEGGSEALRRGLTEEEAMLVCKRLGQPLHVDE